MQPDHIDTSKGTVHLVIGGGGTSIPSNRMFFPEPRCQVLMAVGDIDPATGHKTPRYTQEAAPWSVFRDRDNPCGFVAFDVDPGQPSGNTSMAATYYAVNGPFGGSDTGRQVHLDPAKARLSYLTSRTQNGLTRLDLGTFASPRANS